MPQKAARRPLNPKPTDWWLVEWGLLCGIGMDCWGFVSYKAVAFRMGFEMESSWRIVLVGLKWYLLEEGLERA